MSDTRRHTFNEPTWSRYENACSGDMYIPLPEGNQPDWNKAIEDARIYHIYQRSREMVEHMYFPPVVRVLEDPPELKPLDTGAYYRWEYVWREKHPVKYEGGKYCGYHPRYHEDSGLSGPEAALMAMLIGILILSGLVIARGLLSLVFG